MNIQNMLNIAQIPLVARVSSLDALRVVSDSQRHRILTLLIREPLTAAEIAKRLKIARTRVYYHLDLLEEHGFIQVVGERQVAAMTERTFRACAQRFRVDRGMLAAATSASAVNDAQASVLEHAADDLRARQTPQPDGEADDVLVTRSFLRLTADRAAELRAQLLALVDRFSADGENDGQQYEFAIALFSNPGDGE
jgi:DNA-binding transcriptional ArsR family regulator